MGLSSYVLIFLPCYVCCSAAAPSKYSPSFADPLYLWWLRRPRDGASVGMFQRDLPGGRPAGNTATKLTHHSCENPRQLRRTSLARILGHHTLSRSTSRLQLPEMISAEYLPHLRAVFASCLFTFSVKTHKKSRAPAHITSPYGSPYGNYYGINLGTRRRKKSFDQVIILPYCLAHDFSLCLDAKP